MRSRSRRARTALALVAGAALAACTIAGGDEFAGGFSWSWSITDSGGSTSYTCDEVGAALAWLVIKDADLETHHVPFSCAPGAGISEGLWPVFTGRGVVTAQLTDAAGRVITESAFEYLFDPTAADNVLDPVVFQVAAWDDPRDGADASLTWEWQVDDGEEIRSLGEDDCAALGIDHVTLFARNDTWSTWWSDERMTTTDCAVMDHPESDDLWPGGHNMYSGLHINELLRAGEHDLYLGFYAVNALDEDGDAEAPVLLYRERRSAAELLADETFAEDEGTNRFVTVLDQTLIGDGQGALIVNLTFRNIDGAQYPSCYESDVATLGLTLTSGNWVISEVPLAEGVDCLDALRFARLPITGEPYELTVAAVSHEGDLLWRSACADLQPQAGASLDGVTPVTCDVPNLLQ